MPLAIKTPTLYKIISMVLIVLCFIMMFLPWISVKASAMGFTQRESINLFEIGKDAFNDETCFWVVMLKICMILFFPAMALAIFGALTDRPAFALPVAALAVLMFCFDMFTCFWAKGVLNDMLGGYSDFLGNYGVSYGVHMGVGCWLFLFFGLAAWGVLFYEARISGTDPLDFSAPELAGISLPKVSLGGWSCPNCGKACRQGEAFCTDCGTKKPEPPKCPGCGKPAKPGAAFCSSCGTRLG